MFILIRTGLRRDVKICQYGQSFFRLWCFKAGWLTFCAMQLVKSSYQKRPANTTCRLMSRPKLIVVKNLQLVENVVDSAEGQKMYLRQAKNCIWKPAKQTKAMASKVYRTISCPFSIRSQPPGIKSYVAHEWREAEMLGARWSKCRFIRKAVESWDNMRCIWFLQLCRIPHPKNCARWVSKLRGDEEGDELVVLALSRLCGVAIQPVPGLVRFLILVEPFLNLYWFQSWSFVFLLASEGSKEWLSCSFDGSLRRMRQSVHPSNWMKPLLGLGFAKSAQDWLDKLLGQRR